MNIHKKKKTQVWYKGSAQSHQEPWNQELQLLHMRADVPDWNTEEQLEIWKKEKKMKLMGKNLSKYV